MTTEPAADTALAKAMDASRGLAEAFSGAGHSLYLVGGIVRDHFAGGADADPDLDFTTDARPPTIIGIVESIGAGWWDTGVDFGTIGCRVGSRTFEITTHRADAYEPDSRKPIVAFGDDIGPDLARRDFTVNAMAVDLSGGRLIDPFDGRRDLHRGVLRTPLDPRISFSEDPLRMLRAARFAAGYALDPEPELIAAIEQLTDRIGIVSVERIRIELEKLLLVDDPAGGFDLMVATGLWTAVLPVLPAETAAVRAVAVRAARAEPADRWAALVALEEVDQLDSLRLSNEARATARWLVAAASTMVVSRPSTDRDLRELGLGVPGGEVLERAVDLMAALAGAGHGDPDAAEELRARVADLRAREPDFDHLGLPLDGEQVMELLGLDPGPTVGRALEVLRRHRVEHGPMDEATAMRILGDR